MDDYLLILFSIYILIWASGIYFLWKAYRLGIKNDLQYAKGPHGQPIRNQQKFAKQIAATEMLTGLAIILLAIAIPLLTIKTYIWAPLIFVIGALRLSRLHTVLRQDEA